MHPRMREGGNKVSCLKMKKFVQSRGCCKNQPELTKHSLQRFARFFTTNWNSIRPLKPEYSQLRTKHIFSKFLHSRKEIVSRQIERSGLASFRRGRFIYHNNYCSNGQSQVASIEPDVWWKQRARKIVFFANWVLCRKSKFSVCTGWYVWFSLIAARKFWPFRVPL